MPAPCAACQKITARQAGHKNLEPVGTHRVGFGGKLITVTTYQCSKCASRWQDFDGLWTPVR